MITEDVNVVAVDWSKGALPGYAQAVANVRLVGVEIAYLIYYLHVSVVLNNLR